MNKTISITLGGLIFHIEEAGYLKLQNYLEAIRKYFLEHDNSDDVMDDIETSIAEKFSALIQKNKLVITEADVDSIIAVMGDVADYKDEEADGVPRSAEKDGGQSAETSSREPENTIEEEAPKKLFRNPDDVVIAGVCSGLAAYLGIDPVIMRIVFIASLFFGGAGIIVYAILWIAMPEAVSSSQKLEMRGKPVTIKKIEKIMREKIEPTIGNAGNAARRLVNLPFRILAAIFRIIKKLFLALMPILRFFISFCLVLGSAIGLFFISLMAAVLIFNLDSELIRTGYNLDELSRIMPFNLAVGSVWVIALVPLLVILLLGLSIWSKRRMFNFMVSSVLVGAWMLSIIAFTVIAIDAAPKVEKLVKEYDRAESVEKTFEFRDFNRLEINDASQVHVVPGEEYKISALGKPSDLERLDLHVRNNELIIASKPESGICLFCYSSEVSFEIMMPELEKVAAFQASELVISGFSGNSLTLDLGGAAKADLDVDYNSFELDMSGASKLFLNASTSKQVLVKASGASRLSLEGRADEFRAEVSNASKIDAFDFVISKANVEASGASELELFVTEELMVEAEDASKVYYKGPAKVFEKTSGAGAIKNMRVGDEAIIEFENNEDGVSFEVGEGGEKIMHIPTILEPAVVRVN